MAELSDEQVAELQKADKLLRALYSDNTTGIALKKLIKQKFPDAVMPELDALKSVEDAEERVAKKANEGVAEVKKMVEDMLADRKKEKEDGRVDDFKKRIAKVVKDRSYTEDGEKKLLEIMQSRNIEDPDDAAIIFEARTPKESVAPRSYSTRWNPIVSEGKDDQDFNNLMADPEQWMMDQMYADIDKAKRNPQ